MKHHNILSVLIIGERADVSPSSQSLSAALNATPGIECVSVPSRATNSHDRDRTEPSREGEDACRDFRESLEMGLQRTNGEWVVVLEPSERIATDSTSQLLTLLQSSVHGVRHGWTSLMNEDGSAAGIHRGAGECGYPLMARWWLTEHHPHPSAVFTRRALVHKALQLAERHHVLTRYSLALGITRCCPSKTLELSTSAAYAEQLHSGSRERDRVAKVRRELSLHPIPEQAALWRDYYISRLTEASLHKQPAFLPHSKAQAQALASLLAESKMPMAQILWSIYQDIGLSKQAVGYLSKWSSITENGSASPSNSPQESALREVLNEELRQRSTRAKNILLLTENLSGSPVTAITQLLRESGKNGTTLYTVSYNDGEFQHIFADMAHRGLLGWVRPAIGKKLQPVLENGQQPPEGFVNHFNISRQVPQRSLMPVLDDTEGRVDYVIGHIDDPFISAEIAHLAEYVKSSHTILLQGQLTASKIGPIEETIRRHRHLTSMASRGDITVLRCEEMPTTE